ncbi:MAG: OpgC domain-containing protein [Nakamurella sp.]
MAEIARDITTDPSSPQRTNPARSRDQAIDVLRGLCIISMTTAHLAAGSWPYAAFHVAVLVDGAVGFVLLSGVVLGITQRRTIDRAGLAAGQRRLWRRVGVIYAANLALCLVAVAVVAGDPVRTTEIFHVGALGEPGSVTVSLLTMQLNPHYTSILSLYVVLLLLSAAAVVALAHRAAWIVVAGSFGLYIAGYLWPAVFTFPLYPGVAGAVNWATWQPLFMAGLLTGWYWWGPSIRRVLASRAVLVGCTALVLFTATLGWVLTTGSAAPWKSAVALLFTEGKLGPGTIVMALAAVLVGYRVCRRLTAIAWRVLSPIARIGRHSLDCYLILSVVVLVLPGIFRYEPAGLVGVGVTFDILVLMFGWCLLRDWLARRSDGAPSGSNRLGAERP